MLNLFIEPEHRAGHSDVSKADPLSHQEGTSVQVLIQHSEGSLHILLGLLCSLVRPAKKNDNSAFHNVRYCTVWLTEQKYTELQTCLLNCMIPRVGNTHALAGGMISESAKLTHCSTWAAAWGVAPRRASLLTVVGGGESNV